MTLYNKYLHDFKGHFILYIPLSIILQSCIGSIAAMLILINSPIHDFKFFQLSLCVIVTMAYNASIFAQLKEEWVFNALLISLFTNATLIAINVVQLQYHYA